MYLSTSRNMHPTSGSSTLRTIAKSLETFDLVFRLWLTRVQLLEGEGMGDPIVIVVVVVVVAGGLLLFSS
jgi:hypothetical protein